MIKKLRRRIILINMLLIGVLLAGIFVAVNINSYAVSVSTMERGMNQVLEKESRKFGGTHPPFEDFAPQETLPEETTGARQLNEAANQPQPTVSGIQNKHSGSQTDAAQNQAPQTAESAPNAAQPTAPTENVQPDSGQTLQRLKQKMLLYAENEETDTTVPEKVGVLAAAVPLPGSTQEEPLNNQKQLRHAFGDETPIQISSYVVVDVNASGEIENISENDLSIDEETLEKCVAAAMQSSSNFGQIHQYGVMYTKRGEIEHTKIVFASNSSIYSSLSNSIIISVLLFIGGLAVIFFISLFLSGLAVKPVKKAWEQQKQFIADASHELKTPLTVILANNNIMLSHPESIVKDERQWLESTEEEANHMKKLIDNMLFLAKSDAGTAQVQLSDVDFSEIVEGCALNFEPVAFEKEVLIDTEITPGIIVRGDNTQLNQLAHILTDNAVKYAEENSTVGIRLQRRGEKIEFAVNNRGNVIAEEDIDHIFDRFYRAEKSRTTKGYGLGLAIAQRIAESMNGKISVESNETDGTTFTVVFSGKA